MKGNEQLSGLKEGSPSLRAAAAESRMRADVNRDFTTAASPSKRSIYAALAGNVAVAAVKLLAYLVGGGAAMLVEAIHSRYGQSGAATTGSASQRPSTG
jgi:hypothetical protein